MPSLINYIENIAIRYPSQIAIIDTEGHSLTYQQLVQKTYLLSQIILHVIEKENLNNKNIFPGIAIYLENKLDAILCVLALWKAHIPFLAIDHSTEKKQVAYLLTDSQVYYLITEDHLIRAIPEHQQSLLLFSNLISQALTWATNQNLPHLTMDYQPEEIAYLIYTSGSSGSKKGVMINHRGLAPCLEAQNDVLRYKIKDFTKTRIAQYASLNFDAWLHELMISLCNGATMVIVPEQTRTNAVELTHFYDVQKINVAVMVPSILHLLVSENFHWLEVLFIVGDSFSIELATKWNINRRLLINGYGLTETTICATLGIITAAHNKKDEDEKEVASSAIPILASVPIPSATISIFNEQETLCQAEEKGRIYITGDCLAIGYWNTQELNQKYFVYINDTRWLKTDDLGFLTCDGQLVITGRIPDLTAKISGKRISLLAIKTSIEAYYGINQAEVKLLRENAPILIALIATVLEHHKHHSSRELIAALRTHLLEKYESYAIPGKLRFYIVPNSAFIDKVNLHAQHSNLPPIVSEYTDFPQSEIQLQLAAFWRKLLLLSMDDQISIDDDFCDFGGTSLHYLQLHAFVEKTWNIKIDTPIIKITIRNLENYIFSKRQESTNLVIQKPSIVLLHGLTCLPQIEFSTLTSYILNTHSQLHCFTPTPLEPDEYAQDLPTIASLYLKKLTCIVASSATTPIILCGWSAGGALALELAWQILLMSPRRKIIVGMLDTMYLPALLTPSNHFLLEQFKKLTKFLVNHFINVYNLPFSYETVWASLEITMREFLHNPKSTIGHYWRIFKGIIEAFKNMSANEAVQRMSNFYSALLRYQAENIYHLNLPNLKIIQFSAESSIKKTEDPRLGWPKNIRMLLHPLGEGSNHFNITTKSLYVELIVEAILDILQAAKFSMKSILSAVAATTISTPATALISALTVAPRLDYVDYILFDSLSKTIYWLEKRPLFLCVHYRILSEDGCILASFAPKAIAALIKKIIAWRETLTREASTPSTMGNLVTPRAVKLWIVDVTLASAALPCIFMPHNNIEEPPPRRPPILPAEECPESNPQL